MTDRELLKFAAKAAGYALKWGEVYMVGHDEIDCTDQPYVVSGQPDEADWYWDPLNDDGDALRLAVKLEIQAGYCEFSGEGVAHWNRGNNTVLEYGPDDPYAATRRAIVRAAAAIGKEMP